MTAITEDYDTNSPPQVPEDESGDQLLTAVHDWLARFIVTVSDADIDLLSLWAVHTHVAAECYTSPRLLIDSPVPESGKTTALEHLNRLCIRPVQAASLSSPALLTRMLEHQTRTILIDEADRSLSPDREGVGDLLSVLNSGYKRGATRPVLVPVKGGGWEVSEMSTFSPVAMAGNNPRLAEDTRSRCIRVLLLPDSHGIAEESDWEMLDTDADILAQRITSWTDRIRDDVKAIRPALPDRIIGRFREKWSGLRKIAEIAGGRWPEAVDQMAIQDRQQADLDREDGLIRERPHVLLLRHLMDVWPDGREFVPSEELVSLLVRDYPESWGFAGPANKDLTVQRFGRMLASGYKLNSDREVRGGPRGHYHRQVAAVWNRMHAPSHKSGESGAAGESGASQAQSAPGHPEEPDAPDPGGASPDPAHPAGSGVDTACPSCAKPLTGPNPTCSAARWHAEGAA
jgi:hypothetical protein